MVEKHQNMIARWIMNIIPGRSLEVYLANFSAELVLLTKNVVLAYASKAPDYITTSEQDEEILSCKRKMTLEQIIRAFRRNLCKRATELQNGIKRGARRAIQSRAT